MKTLRMHLGPDSYDILIGEGLLGRAGELLDLRRRVLIVTDDGVPSEYAEMLAQAAKEAVVVTVPAGEASKSLAEYGHLLSVMLAAGFTRKDCVAAVGGGVVGDLAGFAAASYMRGIDFYNIPTTVLSQVDSSVGGKTAVNLDGIKNIVGAFYQPKRVLIDPDTLKTLPERQIANGLAEALKMSLTSDAELFRIFQTEDCFDKLSEIITRAVAIKISVVEQDEKEQGLRRILNFGHTLGHAIESADGMQHLLHGECVGLGMIPMCGERLRPELFEVLRKLGLPTKVHLPAEGIAAALKHDKKTDGSRIRVTRVEEAGSFIEQQMQTDELTSLLALISE